jgi:membrane-associated phospholipid phosphatase
VSRRPPDPVAPLLWAAACAAATIWIAVGAFEIVAVQTADRRALVGFTGFAAGPTVKTWATTLSHLTGPTHAIVFGAALIAVAAWRGGLRLALLVITILVGANLTAQLLQRTVEGARYPAYMSDSIFPSGHTTSAISLAVCAVLVAPAAAGAVVALALGIGVVAIAFSILYLGQHHPSDVLAAITLTGAWTAAAIAALRPRAPGPRGPWARGAAVGALALVLLSAVIARTAHLHAVPASAAEHTTFAAAAAMLAASVLGLMLAAARAAS